MHLPASLARLGIPRRQGFLFLLAIVVPCLLLVGLSVRMLVQERELADKRVADERRRLAGQVRQYLLTRLDRVKLEAISKRVTTSGAPHQPGEQGTVLVLIAPIEHGRILLPWDRFVGAQESRSALDVPLFAEAIRQGERSEHLERRFDTAAGAYRRALTIATVPAQRAFAQLALARALAKAGRAQEAAGLSRALLRSEAKPRRWVSRCGGSSLPQCILTASGSSSSAWANRTNRTPAKSGPWRISCQP